MTKKKEPHLKIVDFFSIIDQKRGKKKRKKLKIREKEIKGK